MKRHNKHYGFMLSLLLLFCVSLLIPSADAQAASTKSKAIKAYKKFLTQDTIRWGNDTYYTAVPTKNCTFSLVYIDNNSVPELVVKNNQDITHVAGFGVVYTYKNGKVQTVNNIQLDGKFYYYKKKGIFLTSYCAMGQSCYTYCKLNKGKSTAKLGKQTDLDTKVKTYYKCTSTGTTDISKAKFNSSLKKLVGSKKKSTAAFHKNTKANRKKYLK